MKVLLFVRYLIFKAHNKFVFVTFLKLSFLIVMNMKTLPRNKTVQEAKKNKNDEFYTLLEDIEKELQHYEY